MTAISEILRKQVFSEQGEVLQAQIREKEYNLRQFKSFVDMSYEEFVQLLQVNCYDILLQRSVNREYEIDARLEPVVRQLYLYFMGNSKCIWNLNAGLIFGGKVGCGKTLLMTSFLRICDNYSRKITTIFHSKALADAIKQNGVEYFSRRPIMIDDLGREESEVKDWGNLVKPVIDIFSLRYEAGARTYCTTNFNFETLEKFYSEFIRTRMEEMMTFVVIPGESRRLKNEIKK